MEHIKMLYSEYLISIKKEIQTPLTEYSSAPTVFICIAMDRLQNKPRFTNTKLWQKQLNKTIRNKVTKEKILQYKHEERMPALLFPELDETKLSPLEKRIKWLDGLIKAALKREAKVAQHSLF